MFENVPTACCCMGPQNGEPVCPCSMRNVVIIDGMYYQITNLGPVSKKTEDQFVDEIATIIRNTPSLSKYAPHPNKEDMGYIPIDKSDYVIAVDKNDRYLDTTRVFVSSISGNTSLTYKDALKFDTAAKAFKVIDMRINTYKNTMAKYAEDSKEYQQYARKIGFWQEAKVF